MAEIKYESKIGQIAANDVAVFRVLSNLENINRFRDVIPQDKIKDMEVSSDRIRFKVDGLGQKIAIAIVEKEEYKLIKFGAESLPIPLNMWIQIIPDGDTASKMRVVAKAEINFMLRSMIEKPLKEGLEKIAEALSMIAY
jgi:carbon monoxide dehydrogenase subunit G